MRVREQVLLESSETTATFQGFHRGEGQPDWTLGQTYTVNGESPSAAQVTEDIPTRGYKRLSAAGAIVNSPFLSTITKVTPVPVTSISKRVTYLYKSTNPVDEYEVGWNWAGTIIPFAGQLLPAFLEMETQHTGMKARVSSLAVTAAHANVDVSTMLAGASIAESGKTVAFLANSMKRAISIGRAVRKLELQRLRKEISVKEFQDRYMEYRYAVRPLVYDVQGVLKAAKQRKGKFRKTFRATEKDSYAYEDVVLNKPVFHETNVDVNRSYKYTVSARAGILCDVNIDAYNTMGLDRPLQTAWELIPFSFIIDWFANVGDVIGAHAPKAGIIQLASWVTTKETIVVKNSPVNAVSTTPPFYSSASNSVAVGKCDYGYEVTTLSRVPSPALSTFPSLKVNLDAYKLTDLSIILRKIFS